MAEQPRCLGDPGDGRSRATPACPGANITTGLMKKPDLRVLMKASDVYRRLRLDLPYFGVGIRKELLDANPGIAAKVGKVFEQCLAGINADTTKAVDLFGSKTGVPTGCAEARHGIQTSRLQLSGR